MRKAVLLTLAVPAILGAAQAIAQQPESYGDSAAAKTSYTFDPVHAVMTAAPSASFPIAGKVEADPAAVFSATTYTGTAVVLLTVKLISAVPKEAVVRCGGNVGLEYLVQEQVTTTTSIGGFSSQSSSESVLATIANGTATCRLTIPYSWTIPASTSKTTVTIQGVTGSIGISETAVQPTGVVNTVVTLRSTTTSLTGPTTPPADGTINLRANTVL